MEPHHSKGQIDKAGRFISLTPEELGAQGAVYEQQLNDAFAVLSDWRGLHAYPLSAVSGTLRRRASAISADVLIAQRLKRFVSIRQKLRGQPGMALARMQDVAGCRAVVPSIDHVYVLKRQYENYARSSPKRGPELLWNSTKDYIFAPKDDGYRGVHMVMKYRSANRGYAGANGLRVEIQIRSRLQHAWAMAVETVSASTAQALKAGHGREEWKRFFKFMASAIALKEDMPMVPGTDELFVYKEIRELALDLRVIPLLETVRPAVETVIAEEKSQVGHPDDLYLLELNAEQNTVGYTKFPKHQYVDALAAYAAAERRNVNDVNIHVVLVSVRDIESLRSAYPSYFLDMTEFIALIREALDIGADHMLVEEADRASLISDLE